MNQQQFRLMGWIKIQEDKLAEVFQGESEGIRKMQKDLLHYHGMKEFDRLAQQVELKLSDKDCDDECIFCHPELDFVKEEEFKENLGSV